MTYFNYEIVNSLYLTIVKLLYFLSAVIVKDRPSAMLLVLYIGSLESLTVYENYSRFAVLFAESVLTLHHVPI